MQWIDLRDSSEPPDSIIDDSRRFDMSTLCPEISLPPTDFFAVQ
jgi:hypothetical protein